MLELLKIIDSEFLVVTQRELTDDGTQDDLRRLHIHFVQDLCDLHDDLAIAEDDDRVGALIRDDLGVADRHRFRCCIYRRRGKFL